jgi:hypothetical protein
MARKAPERSVAARVLRIVFYLSGSLEAAASGNYTRTLQRVAHRRLAASVHRLC